jgi:hypothetical protein
MVRQSSAEISAEGSRCHLYVFLYQDEDEKRSLLHPTLGKLFRFNLDFFLISRSSIEVRSEVALRPYQRLTPQSGMRDDWIFLAGSFVITAAAHRACPFGILGKRVSFGRDM